MSDLSKTQPDGFGADPARQDSSPSRKASSAARARPAGETMPTPEELQPGFPQLEILKLVGRGGMGAVYKARHLALDRFVALKLLSPELSVHADFARRFEREARAMGRLSHPNIVTVHDSGRTPEGRWYLIMEYVEGTARAQMIRSGALDKDKVLQLTVEVCQALAYAHSQGVVHRDVKPANVMVDEHGHAKVTDFGLARLMGQEIERGMTTTGTVIGTLDYMAPEQRVGEHVDHRADIFSLGVMLYEMLCREIPRGAFVPPSARSGCDSRIDTVVTKAMQQEREKRYQDAAELKTDVESIRTKVEPSRPWLPIAGVVALLIAVALLVIFGPRIRRDSGTVSGSSTVASVSDEGNLLAASDPGGVGLEGFVRVADGWLSRPAGKKQESHIICGPVGTDHGVRVTYLPARDGSDAELQIILRASGNFKSLYRVQAAADEWAIVHREPSGTDPRAPAMLDPLCSIPRNDEMRRAGERMVEFRIVGNTLSFFFNGKKVGEARDAAILSGRPRLGCRAGLVLKKVEYLDLTGGSR